MSDKKNTKNNDDTQRQVKSAPVSPHQETPHKRARLMNNHPVVLTDSASITSASSSSSSSASFKNSKLLAERSRRDSQLSVTSSVTASSTADSSAGDPLASTGTSVQGGVQDHDGTGKNAESSLPFQSSMVYVRQHLDQYRPKDAANSDDNDDDGFLASIEKIRLELPGGTPEEYVKIW